MANFTLLAENKNHDYIQQAYLAACSIKKYNKNANICLITNDEVTPKQKSVFDDIVEIPWYEQKESRFSAEHRWKVYHATPFDKTFVLDTDVLVLENIEHWWKFLDKKDLFFTSNIKTYRGTTYNTDYYRHSFKTHQLPNIYCALYYFKKCDDTHTFFKLLELVMNNWELFYGQFAGGKYFQKFPSMDVSCAIAVKLLNIEKQVTSNTSFPHLTHMKLHGQDWWDIKTESWQDKVGVYLDADCDLFIGNYKQSGVFHYTEKNFVTQEMIETFEKGIL